MHDETLALRPRGPCDTIISVRCSKQTYISCSKPLTSDYVQAFQAPGGKKYAKNKARKITRQKNGRQSKGVRQGTNEGEKIERTLPTIKRCEMACIQRKDRKTTELSFRQNGVIEKMSFHYD